MAENEEIKKSMEVLKDHFKKQIKVSVDSECTCMAKRYNDKLYSSALDSLIQMEKIFLEKPIAHTPLPLTGEERLINRLKNLFKKEINKEDIRVYTYISVFLLISGLSLARLSDMYLDISITLFSLFLAIYTFTMRFILLKVFKFNKVVPSVQKKEVIKEEEL